MWMHTVFSEWTVKELNENLASVTLTIANTVIRMHRNPLPLCLPESKARNNFVKTLQCRLPRHAPISKQAQSVQQFPPNSPISLYQRKFPELALSLFIIEFNNHKWSQDQT